MTYDTDEERDGYWLFRPIFPEREHERIEAITVETTHGRKVRFSNAVERTKTTQMIPQLRFLDREDLHDE
jgi:hypothetical protein